MLDYIDQSLKKDIIGDSKPELPGFMQDESEKRKWVMKFRVFNLEIESDTEEIEDIYTRSSNKNPDLGISIFHEIGRFFDDGSFKIMIRWGEWHVEKKNEPEV